jgi:ATP-binding cassette subfamily C protein
VAEGATGHAGQPAGQPLTVARFLAVLARYDPRKFAWTVAVQIAAALTHGVGIVLLLPILAVTGVASSQGGIAGGVRSALETAGIPVTLRWMLAAYVAIVALAAALNAYQNVLTTRYCLGFVDGLRGRMYAAIAQAEWRHLLALRHSDLLTTLTVTVGSVMQGTIAVLRIGSAMFLIAVLSAIAIRLSPEITAVAAVSGLALTGLVWPVLARSRRLGQDLVDSNKAVMGTATDFLDGLKLAKAHGLEAGHVATFNSALGRARDSQVQLTKASAAVSAVQTTATALVLAVLVTVAVERLHLALNELLVLAFIFMRLVPQINGVQRDVQIAAQSMPSFEDLAAFTESCEGAGERLADAGRQRASIGSGVVLDRVSFTYPGNGAEVLHNVSLEIPSRSTTALVGVSGAGKTTLADLAIGLMAPTAGSVLIDGEPISGLPLRRWRNAVAMVPQDPFLFHETIRANLLWGRPDADEADLWAALGVAAASDFVAALADGLDTVVGDRGTRLSGGERQRLALARALLRRPELLVLDEATSSLDTEHELAIRTALAGLRGELTIIVIAHRLSTVSHADCIVVVDDGRVVEAGTWDELSLREQGRLRALIEAGRH